MNRIAVYTIIAIVIAASLMAANIAIKSSSSQSNSKYLVSMDNVALNSSMLAALHLPNSVFAKVGIGSASNFPTVINAPAISIYGKPAIVYIGADYCPYCAAERWGLVLALSRFGNFTSLHYMTSSSSDYSPNTPTFTFYNSSYNSRYISLLTAELTTNKLSANGYAPLQNLTTQEQQIFDTYDLNNSALPPSYRGAIPFVDFAGHSMQVGSNFNPTLLQNSSWSSIIAMLNNTNSTISQYVVGSANLVSAEICIITNSTPPLCQQGYMKNIINELKST
ncbi:MAG: DUF929 family protein [Candidatus Micrarchaeia archaeon]